VKKVLIITNYFPPETGAASNRILHLAEGLQKQDFKVSVVTPLPNYPTGKIFNEFKGRFSKTSEKNNIKIHRLWIYASNSKNKVLRLFAMLSYSLSLVWFFLTHKIPKTVIVQSPPLIVAFTCMFFLSNKRQLILNVSDLWPIYQKAIMVLGQSEEILTHVSKIVPDKKTLLYRNFPDFNPPELIDNAKNSSGKIKMVYAGLLGIAQGIYKLCENLDYTNIEFHIYGNGPETNKIEAFIASNPNLPILYHGEVKRSKLHLVLMHYDLTIIPLLNRIYGSVPSKIFEYSRLGLPIVYFGGGEGETIIEDNELGWIAEAGNYRVLNDVLGSIDSNQLDIALKKKLRNKAFTEFDFKKQLVTLTEFLKN